MALFLLILGIIVIVIGALLLFYPKGIYQFNRTMDKVLFKDRDIISHNVFAAVLFILVGLWFLYIYFYYAF